MIRQGWGTSGLGREIRRVESGDGADGAYEDACRRLLHLLRLHVGMDVAWTSEFVGSEQVFRFVDSDPGAPSPAPGSTTPLNDAYCSRVLTGAMPALIPNARDDPSAVWLDVTFTLRIGSYLGVPLHGVDGTPNGMLCVISSAPAPLLDEQDLTTVRLVAQVLDDLHRRALGEATARREQATLRAQVAATCAGEGRQVVLHPIVDLRTGTAVAAEGLTRFEDARRTPSGWFAAAHSVGLGAELEHGAARAVLERLDAGPVPPALSVNLSPEVVLTGLGRLLDGVDVSRVILEVTEYSPIADYQRLHRVLDPYREVGLQVAVDDAGAGYASLNHVLQLRPDLLKIDMSLVRDVDSDPVRQALLAAVVRFSDVAGATVVAEGVETPAELETLLALGVPLAQGYLFGQPCAEPAWQYADLLPPPCLSPADA